MPELLDTTILADLQELSPEDPRAFLTELFETYQTQAALDILQLETEGNAKNWIQVSKAAHRLKSASMQLGAIRVGELAEKIETLTRPGTGDATVIESIRLLKDAYCESEILFVTYLNKM
jgi:HPt (histidine-containing phosphotransfer) domain-containing protein